MVVAKVSTSGERSRGGFRARLAATLCASALVHLVLSTIAAGALGRVATAEFRHVDLDLVSTPEPAPPPAEQAPAPTVEPPPRVENRPSARPRKRRAVRRQTDPAPAVASRPASPGPAARSISLRMRAPDLSPVLAPASAAVGPVERPAATHSEPSPEARLTDAFAEDQARHNIRSGRVHPSHYRFLRDAIEGLKPDWSIVRGDRLGRGGAASNARMMLRAMHRFYLNAHTERRKLEGMEAQEGRIAERGYKGRAFKAVMRAMEQEASALRTELCATVSAGRVGRIKRRRSSGLRKFDAMAMKALRRAIARRPEQVSDAPPARVCYRFVARYYRAPPLPTIGCTFDETKPSMTCIYPMKRVVKVTGRLLSSRPL